MDKLESYLRVIKEKYEARELIKVADQVKLGAHKGKDIAKLKSTLSSQLSRKVVLQEKLRNARESAVDYMEHFGEIPNGIKTGIRDFDIPSGGLVNGNLIILAGRPGSGKSALAMFIALNAARQGYNVLFQSMEMTEDELIRRAISSESLVSLNSFIARSFDLDEMERATSASFEMPQNLYIDDEPTQTIEYISSRYEELEAEGKKPDLIISDYLQKTDHEENNEFTRVGRVAEGYKRLAREKEVPVLALAQLSRKPETRDDKRPVMSDLGESGKIEREADVALFLYRDEYYSPTDENKGIAELITGKGRNIRSGKVYLGYLGEYTKFYNLKKGA